MVAGGDDGCRNAGIEQGTAWAAVIIDGWRQWAITLAHETNGFNDGPGFLAERGVEFDGPASVSGDRVDSTRCDIELEHLFQAKGLGAKLQVVVAAHAAGSMFIFHRDDGAIGVEFDNIGPALQPESIGPKRQAALNANALLQGSEGFIGSLVSMAATEGKDILIENLLDVNEGTLAWTVGEMFQG